MIEIKNACQQFQTLLEEQLKRLENMNGEKVDFSQKETVTIGIIDGDGIGPIISAESESARSVSLFLNAPCPVLCAVRKSQRVKVVGKIMARLVRMVVIIIPKSAKLSSIKEFF